MRIRRALALALDLPQIVETVTNGVSKPSRSAIPRPSSYYGKDQAALAPRDLAAAKKLLAEAGYRGQPIKMLTSKRYVYIFSVAMLVQAMAQEAGINIEVEVLDWATLQDRYAKGDYQMLSYTYSARLDPSLSYEMFSGPKEREPAQGLGEPAGAGIAGAVAQRRRQVQTPGTLQPAGHQAARGRAGRVHVLAGAQTPPSSPTSRASKAGRWARFGPGASR